MSQERKADDFGAHLREARERKGVSLRAIADITRISMPALEALERNDISRLPGGIFTRAFVRSYTSEVGLNPATMVEEFVRQFPDGSAAEGHPTVVRHDNLDSFKSDRRAVSLGVKLALFAVPIAALAIYVSVAGWPGRARVPSAHTASAPVAVALPRPARLIVEVLAKRSSTLSYAIDGQQRIDVALPPLARRALDAAADLMLTFGDAGAVEVTINGTPAKSLGPSGGVATLHLTLDNYRSFMVER